MAQALLRSLLSELDATLDRRLWETVLALAMVLIIQFTRAAASPRPEVWLNYYKPG